MKNLFAITGAAALLIGVMTTSVLAAPPPGPPPGAPKPTPNPKIW